MTSTNQTRGHGWVVEQLGRYLDGDVSGPETATVAEHIAGCDICQRRLAELRGVERTFAEKAPQPDPASAYVAHLLERLRGDPGTRRYNLLTADALETLPSVHSSLWSVVSLYLDVRSDERQDSKAHEKLQHMIDEQKRELANAPEARQRAVQTEVDRLIVTL